MKPLSKPGIRRGSSIIIALFWLVFVSVPEKKSTKNRVHVDLLRMIRARKKRSPASSTSAPASSTTVAAPTPGAGS